MLYLNKKRYKGIDTMPILQYHALHPRSSIPTYSMLGVNTLSISAPGINALGVSTPPHNALNISM
jgi:hypothetical protein